MRNLETAVRELGYQLACREIYGENCAEYFMLKEKHNKLLYKLYRLQKRNWQITNKAQLIRSLWWRADFFCKPLVINDLRGPGRRKLLMFNDLWQSFI